MSKNNVVEFCYPIDQTSNAEGNFGRRIYINEESFAYLAASTVDNAKIVFSSLAPVSTIKTAHHHLEQAIDFRLIEGSRAKSILQKISKHWGHKITEFLHKVGYRPREPHKHQDFYPVILRNEKVVATCYDVNYYTFSTSILAAMRMYEDVDDIQHVKKSVMDGTDNQDLTIMRGHSLAFINPELGTGINKAKLYLHQTKYKIGLDKNVLMAIKEEIQFQIKEELLSLISEYLINLNDREKLVLMNMVDGCSQSINKGLLRVK